MIEKDYATTRKGIPLNVLQDTPDLRDWVFTPSLKPLKPYQLPPRSPLILDQGREGACTGFALAAAINYKFKASGIKKTASARMLYEMAKKHDEWPGEDYSGSSCRGALKGWAHMGVCENKHWPFVEGSAGYLTVKRAKAARHHRVGAYYRLQSDLSHYHAALNEGDVVFCSAQIHEGWDSPNGKTGEIVKSNNTYGAHAFVLVGYNKEGFWIQNSWGKTWGKKGLALWPYEDWQENILDGWVFTVALSTPQLAHQRKTGTFKKHSITKSKAPQRHQIAGHFVHVDDGRFHEQGSYWSTKEDIAETAQLLSQNKNKYQHLLLYAHGGLNSPKDSARRIAAMKQTFKSNGIYPFHFMYDTGLMEELKDVILRHDQDTTSKTSGFADWSDRFLEWGLRKPGRALWREMKRGANSPFSDWGAGTETLNLFHRALTAKKDNKLKVHIVGHSTGAILLAFLLDALEQQAPELRIESCHLMAPANTIALFRSHYHALLLTPKTDFGINKMHVYNLNEQLEKDDSVGWAYRKSLLHLVSKSFEESVPESILGLENYSRELMKLLKKEKRLDLDRQLLLHYSDGHSSENTRATEHGLFDNDPVTMNHILKTILGKKPSVSFNKDILDF